MHRVHRFLWIGLLLLVCLPVLAAPGQVTLMKTPEEGIQPQAAVDSKGVVHLLYFKGDPGAGDLFYTRLAPGERAPRPAIRVNSQPGSAIATGTIRGGQIALGMGDSVHVAWNGSEKAAPKGPGGNPMLYTHLNEAGTAFEPQRNLITWAGGLDGGGTLAADPQGHVYVAWHANPQKDGEANRCVYMARSTDNGKRFEKEIRINPQPTGVCGCCSLRAFADSGGDVYVFYRAATKSVDRDMILLRSRNRGASFESQLVDTWNLNACPMSSSSMVQKGKAVLAAWETREQVFYGLVGAAKETPIAPARMQGSSGTRKHPVLAVNGKGETLFAWTEGTGWNRGGSLAWQVTNAEGQVITQGRSPGVPVWGLLSAFTRPDGSFVLVY